MPPVLPSARSPSSSVSGLAMQREIETLAAPSAATHRVFGTAINRGVVFSVSLDLGGSHPVHFARDQGIAGLVELEWIDDRHHDFHGFKPRASFASGCLSSFTVE